MRLSDYLLHKRGNDLAVRLIGVGIIDKVGVIVAYPPCLLKSLLFRLSVKLKIADDSGQVGGSHISRLLTVGRRRDFRIFGDERVCIQIIGVYCSSGADRYSYHHMIIRIVV